MVSNFVERIFWIESQLQLAHWQEQRGFHHKMLGDFYKKIVKGFDKLVEGYLGDRTKQVLISDSLYKLDNNVDLQEIINELRKFLDDLHEAIEFNERGLNNIVDNLYNTTEKYSYLLNKK